MHPPDDLPMAERWLDDLAAWWELEHAASAELGEAPDVTHQRGADAIRAFATRPELKRARNLWLGEGTPVFDGDADLSFRDERLDASQRVAVERAAQAREALLVHGPPGTGKTRTLVEIVRQALRKRERILVTAPSNIAVDNLARRLAAQRVKVLRLGALDVVAPDLHEHTLHQRAAQLEEMTEARAKFAAAQRMADGKGRSPADPRRAIGKLRREAHVLQNAARAKVMRRARVVCATASGVDAVPLGDDAFDLVVLDEATQAPTPLALAALLRGGRAVLAGDPEQLPPTVLTQDPDALAGLSESLFERCAARWPAMATVMLTTQYRMAKELMAFPSRQHYGGRLEAGADNRDHTIDDLLEAPLPADESRPWIVIDSSQTPDAERRDAGTSVLNPHHQAIAVAQVRRRIEAGIDPGDIAAICTYAAQADALREALADLVEQGLEVGTVDGFQGREKEVVIVDLVRSNSRGELGFLRDVRRTNVAITRAKRQLILIANTETLTSHSYYRALFDAARECGAWHAAP